MGWTHSFLYNICMNNFVSLLFSSFAWCGVCPIRYSSQFDSWSVSGLISLLPYSFFLFPPPYRNVFQTTWMANAVSHAPIIDEDRSLLLLFLFFLVFFWGKVLLFVQRCIDNIVKLKIDWMVYKVMAVFKHIDDGAVYPKMTYCIYWLWTIPRIERVNFTSGQ